MDISSDYRDLFAVLNKHKVKYLVVGAYAVIYYTRPRYSKDLDIWVKPERANAERLYEALREFGAPVKSASPLEFISKKMIYQIGVEPIRVDIITSIPAIQFDKAWRNKKKSRYAGVSINILGVKDLIASKRRLKRKQDLIDLEALTKSKRD